MQIGRLLVSKKEPKTLGIPYSASATSNRSLTCSGPAIDPSAMIRNSNHPRVQRGAKSESRGISAFGGTLDAITLQ